MHLSAFEISVVLLKVNPTITCFEETNYRVFMSSLFLIAIFEFHCRFLFQIIVDLIFHHCFRFLLCCMIYLIRTLFYFRCRLSFSVVDVATFIALFRFSLAAFIVVRFCLLCMCHVIFVVFKYYRGLTVLWRFSSIIVVSFSILLSSVVFQL